MHLREIREAIAVEQEKQRDTFIFKVARAKQISRRIAALTVQVGNDRRNSDTLNENMEGANAWWPLGPGNHGKAQVLSVFPEDNELHLTRIQGELPDSDTQLRIYPPDFIQAVRKLYYDPLYQEAGLAIYRGLDSRLAQNDRVLPVPEPLTLRERQQAALQLPYLSHALLVGPPGTGKTYTLAAIIAQFLIHEPDQRVLLLSNSNAAVDDALVKVDKALETLGDQQRMQRGVRIGSNFTMAHYEGREHLLPSKPELTDRLKALEKQKPNQREAVAYDAWLTQYDNVRQQIDDHTKALIQYRPLVAATASSASFRFEQLKKGNFDWVVFDEASQVSLYQVIALLPLGRRYLFCGDDRQLPPVCVAHHNTQASRWVGKSIFSKREKFPHDAMIKLNEQDRMLGEICRLVSHQFYNDDLYNASPGEGRARNDWLKARKLTNAIYSRPVEVVFVDEASTWRKRFMGEVRPSSAKKAVEIYQTLADEREVVGSDAVILSPLHSQLRLIRETARKAGLSSIPCSTIHKAQGQEYHTVILDVINLSGSNRFLTETLSKELINVAFSRAKARLIILAHESDLNSSHIKAAYQASKPSPAPSDFVIPEDVQDIKEHVPIGDHNIQNIQGKRFKMTLKNGQQKLVEPIKLQDRFLNVIVHPEGEEKSYLLRVINGL